MNDPLDTLEPPAPKPRRWPWILGCAGCGCLSLMAVLGALLVPRIAATTREIPGTAVTRGDALPATQVEWIRDNVGLQEGESIEWFYSTGFLTIEEDGQFVTNQRVVSYAEVAGGDVETYSCTFDEIESLEIEWAEGLFGDTLLTVYPTDDAEGFYVILSGESGLDRVFVDYIEERRR